MKVIFENSNRENNTENLVVNTSGSFNVNINFEQYRPNGRLDYFIAYVVSGKIVIHEPYGDLIARPGDIMFYRPNERQKYSLEKDNSNFYFFLHFTGFGCEELLKKIGIGEKRLYSVGESETLKQLFEKLEKEFLFKRPFYNEHCLGLAYEIFSVLGRKLLESESFDVNMDKRIVMVCNKMLRDYMEWHTINYYAELCNLSISRFSHLFKSQVGSTPLDYLMSLRITRASEMLSGTELSVSRIAQLIGFNDYNYFIRVFKKYKGKTPANFRKKL